MKRDNPEMQMAVHSMVTMATTQFDWSKPILLHNFINIPHRALQNGSLERLWTMLYYKMSAILNFDKPRDPNASFICYHPCYPSYESLLEHSTCAPIHSTVTPSHS